MDYCLKGSSLLIILRRGNKFLDPNPQTSKNIETLKKDKEQLLEHIKELEYKNEKIIELIEEEHGIVQGLEQEINELNSEILYLKERISEFKEEKDLHEKTEKEIMHLLEELSRKKMEYEKELLALKIEKIENTETIVSLNVFLL